VKVVVSIVGSDDSKRGVDQYTELLPILSDIAPPELTSLRVGDHPEVIAWWPNLKKGAVSRFSVMPAGWNLAIGRGKRRLLEKKLRFGGSKLGACDMLSPLQEPNRKSWLTWQPVRIWLNLHH
jgi:hypothetical protein